MLLQVIMTLAICKVSKLKHNSPPPERPRVRPSTQLIILRFAILLVDVVRRSLLACESRTVRPSS